METRTIAQWLENGHNLIIITGPNGQNKTKMLLEYNDLTYDSLSQSSPGWHEKTRAIYQAFVLEDEANLMNYFSEPEITKLKKFKVDNDSQSIKKKIKEALLEIKKVPDQTDQPDLNLEAKADAIFEELFVNKAQNFQELDNNAYENIIRLQQTINKKIRDIAIYLEFSRTLPEGALLLKLFIIEYFKLIEKLRDDVLNEWKISELFTFYCSLQPDVNKLSLHDFIQKIRDVKFRRDLSIKYARNGSDLEAFLKEFNAELKEINYKYQIDIQFQDYHNPKILFTTGNVSIEASELKLSSGEKAILSYLIWRHVVSKVTNLEYMLLDEPDRHLDPKLCKQFLDMITEVFVRNGIKVIMTTHRIDTVALSPRENIFKTCEPENQGSVTMLKRIHRLEALFRMTANIRSLTNLHYAVYTEGVPDANFYAGVYLSLRKYSQKVRVKQKSNPDPSRRYIWDISNNPKRILSERCQLSFYPTNSDGQGGGGGISQVVTCLVRELANASQAKNKIPPNQNELNSRWLFGEPGLHYACGLIDHDRHESSKLVEGQITNKTKTLSTRTQSNILNTIVYTYPRNCLEHFAYDPFVFYSAFEGKKISDEIKIENLQENDRELFDFLTKLQNWIERFKNASKDQKEIVKAVMEYFDLLNKRIAENFDKTRKLEDKSMGPKYLISEKAKVKNTPSVPKKTIIKSIDESFEVDYPQFFLEMNGHVLEHVLFDMKNGKRFTARISENIQFGGLKMIPLDLANIIFKLNDKVRKYVRIAIGKDPAPEANVAQKSSYTYQNPHSSSSGGDSASKRPRSSK